MISYNNIVASFYKFSPWTDYKSFRGNIQTICEKNKVLGTILLASEGINGSISGDEMSIKNVMTYVKSLDNFSDLQIKYSKAFGKTFRKMRVRLKKEIVTMGKHGVNPHELTGKLLQPDDWDKLLDERDVIVVDTRNTYEHSIGSFIGASFTNTKSFRDFPEWADKNLNKSKNQKIAMYCTGGIRCEKASSYLLGKGYKNVYQLNGGILSVNPKITQNGEVSVLYLTTAYHSSMGLKRVTMICVTHAGCLYLKKIDQASIMYQKYHVLTAMKPKHKKA